MIQGSPIWKVLDEARWAPSGDNTQPWRFEVTGPMALVVHGHDTRAHCVYDLEGEASQLSLGALLETMRIAATRHGWSTAVQRRAQQPDDRPTFDVAFTAADLRPDPLAEQIRVRSVQRRPLSTNPLSPAELAALESSVGDGYQVHWLSGWRGRLAAANLTFCNAGLRLTLPEAYEVHRSIIEWGATHSESRVPDAALGVDALSLKLMRWGLGSWARVHFANRFLAGTWLPRIQMDWIPGLACAAHVVIKSRQAPAGVDDFVAAGRAVQRFWLTATQLGLWQQPEMTPLIFARYVRQGTQFTANAALQVKAQKLQLQVNQVIGLDASHAVWMGRVGHGVAPIARSMRLPLTQLMWDWPVA